MPSSNFHYYEQGYHIIFVFFLISAQLEAQTPIEVAQEYRKANGHQVIKGFSELLQIPNVATDLPNIKKNAQFLLSAFAERGVRMELLEIPDAPPIVYGELMVPGADRTLIIYVHYDGQPVDPTKWKTGSPWTGHLYSGAMENGGKPIPMPKPGDEIDPEWRIYGRSAGDDKAPFPALLAVLDAFQQSNVKMTSNLKFFFEGEEEAGSPNLGAYEQAYGDYFDGDIWLVFDGPVHQTGRPQIVYGVRGIAAMDLTIYGANRSLHSGHYGNFVPVPGQMMASLLNSMKHENGKVLIKDFYNSTAPISEADRDAINKLAVFDDDIRKQLGISWSEGENAPFAERLLLPSFTVRGLSSGNVDELARNVVPSTAAASIGMRLVKGNDPENMMDLVENHIREEGYHIVREEPDQETRLKYKKIIKVNRRHGYPASRTSMDTPITQNIVKAIARISDQDPIMVPTYGASLPVFHFTERNKQPLLIIPVANYDDNQHAPDENLRIGNLWFAIDLYASLFTMN